MGHKGFSEFSQKNLSMGHKEDFYAVFSQLFLYPKKLFWFNQGNLPVTNFLNIGPCIHFLSKTKIRKDIYVLLKRIQINMYFLCHFQGTRTQS